MFAVGDKVKLLAMECPELTVSNVAGANGADVTCRWFGKEGDFYEKLFHAGELGTPEDAHEAVEKAKHDRTEKVKAEKKAKADAEAAEAAAVKEAEAEAKKEAAAEKKAHPHTSSRV